MAEPVNNPNYPSYQTYPVGSGFLGAVGVGDYYLKLAAEINNSAPAGIVGNTSTVVSPALNYERAILRKAERDAFVNAFNGATPGFKTLLNNTAIQRMRAAGR